jgi:hypothetical protein
MSEKTIGFAPLTSDELVALRIKVWLTQGGQNIASVMRAQNLVIHRLLLDAFYEAFLVNPADKVFTAPRMTEFLHTMTEKQGENAMELVKWIIKFTPVQYCKAKNRFEINKQATGKLALYSIADESRRAYIFWQWAIDTGLSCVENNHDLYNIIRKAIIVKIFDSVKGIRKRAYKTEVCDTCRRRITFRALGKNKQKAYDVDNKNYVLGAHICNEIPSQSLYTVSGGIPDSNRRKH